MVSYISKNVLSIIQILMLSVMDTTERCKIIKILLFRSYITSALHPSKEAYLCYPYWSIKWDIYAVPSIIWLQNWAVKFVIGITIYYAVIPISTTITTEDSALFE